MRDIMVSHIHIFLWFIAVGELGFVYDFASELVAKKKPIVACMLAVAIGLTFDAFVIALGGIIDEVPIMFSRVRFIFHGIFIPFVLPICGYALKFKKFAMCIDWVITLILMGLGLAESLNVKLIEVAVGANIRYAAGPETPEWAMIISFGLSFGTLIPLVISSIIVRKREKDPFLFGGSLAMLFFASIGPVTGNMDLQFAITMLGEICMLAGYYFYLKNMYGELQAEQE